jgi:hypothetical protein
MIGLSGDASTLVGYRVVSSAETPTIGGAIATRLRPQFEGEGGDRAAGARAVAGAAALAANRCKARGHHHQARDVTRNGVVRASTNTSSDSPKLAAGLPEAETSKGTE